MKLTLKASAVVATLALFGLVAILQCVNYNIDKIDVPSIIITSMEAVAFILLGLYVTTENPSSRLVFRSTMALEGAVIILQQLIYHLPMPSVHLTGLCCTASALTLCCLTALNCRWFDVKQATTVIWAAFGLQLLRSAVLTKVIAGIPNVPFNATLGAWVITLLTLSLALTYNARMSQKAKESEN